MKYIGTLFLIVLALPVSAAEDAFEFYKEEAQVVTASRRAEPAWRAPAAVDVVTAEDIKAYGFKEIWDALRYRAGMDVIDGRSLDGNRALVSARGFDAEFVTQMQVLVDGRSVYSPFLGGVYWQSLPVQNQDIERIEIVRGPNAALYGSNAAIGVINIITKKPGSGASGAVAAWGGSRSVYGARAAAEAGNPDAGLRFSFLNRAEAGHPASDGGKADDFLHLNKLNGRGRWNPDSKTELDLRGGGAWITAGLPGLAADAQTRHAQNFESAAVSRRLDGDAAVEASVSRAETTINNNPLNGVDVAIRTYQYDAAALHRFTWLDERVKSSWGVDWRFSGADSDQGFKGRPAQSNRVYRGFTHHSVRLWEPVTVVVGVSLEHSNTGGTQPAWQTALLVTPSAEHALRLSYSLAPTLPSLFQREANYALAPGKTYLGNSSFAPEHLSAWEAGWSSRLLDGALKSGLSAYYMEIRDRSFLAARSAAPAPGVILFNDNRDRAIARGIEASLEYAFGPARAAFINYTFERITNSRAANATGGDARRSTPQNKFNVGARAALPRNLSASFVVGYKDLHVVDSNSRGSIATVPRHFRLDARLSWSPRPEWEIFVAGQELLQPYTREYADGTASPRTVRGGAEWRFGP